MQVGHRSPLSPKRALRCLQLTTTPTPGPTGRCDTIHGHGFWILPSEGFGRLIAAQKEGYPGYPVCRMPRFSPKAHSDFFSRNLPKRDAECPVYAWGCPENELGGSRRPVSNNKRSLFQPDTRPRRCRTIISRILPERRTLEGA